VSDNSELLDDLRALAGSVYPCDSWTNQSLKDIAKRAIERIEELEELWSSGKRIR